MQGKTPTQGEVTTRKYVVLFSFSGEAIGRFLQNPSDRAEVVRKLADAIGGSLECYYWMLGQYDGLAIIAAPDSDSVAALSLAVTGTGTFKHFETHELIEASDLIRISQRAKELQSSYQAPGSTS
jgi:uncharacterized protein with GYD domain